MMRKRTAPLTVALLGALGLGFSTLAACGGGGPTRPVPLSTKFDDAYIDPLPVDKQSGAIAAKNEIEPANRARAKAKADFDASKLQIDVAVNEKKAADLDVSSARSRKVAADASADQNRINTAMGELRGSEKYVEALAQRLEYLRAYRAWLETVTYYTEENMYWQEAKYELAKADVAKANGIAPKGFAHDDFARQNTDRQKKVASRRDTSEAARKRALDARGKWLKLQAEADKMLGKASSFEDPMSNATSTGTAITQGGGTMDIGGGGGDVVSPKADNPVTAPTPAPTPDPAPAPDGD